MAAIFMFSLLCAGIAADQAFPSRHQNVIGLRKLRLEQSIKRIVEVDFKCGASCTPLSHAFLARLKTRPALV
jgi:hypothetical protein